MAHFNEDTRVKIPATIQFLRLGYNYQSLKSEDVAIDFNTKIFINRFKPAIERINNRKLSDEDVVKLISDIHDSIKHNDLGKDFYNWLINPMDRIKLIDFDWIENNDFAVVDELPFTVTEGTEKGSFRPDINILINGIPLAFLEVKKPNNEGGIQKEFDRMINQRLENPEYVKFFNMIQIVTFSNNMEYMEADDAEDVKAGSFYTTPNGHKTTFSFLREDDEQFLVKYPYKDIDEKTIKEVMIDCGYNPNETDTPEFQENLKTTSPCNSFVTSLFDKERVLYMLHYGMMFIDEKVPQKHIMRYPQFFATRRILQRLDAGSKRGICWHGQGSGKTGLAAFSNRIIRDYYAKRETNTRFFFVVDRLDLLTQASTEFTNRGLQVINCDSKADFAKELNKTLPTNIGSDSIGEMCVVNIQKFAEDTFPQAANDYHTKVQRVFFIDEAHRSYSIKGEFFKNLMTCDPDAVYIALTGTPLLSKKERSNLKFGDYIHKYFYDKSIADGYTLRIKKENIDTVSRAEIKRNLDVDDKDLEKRDIFESDDYVNALGSFIDQDFTNFRLQNCDDTIGGMIVCRTNQQAKKVHEWFEKNSKLVTGLVITDISDPRQKEINKNNQLDFREGNKPDILVVNMMLTTGYDVKRLKKMYLLRGPHAQSLLQTISRVNRPYKSPTGRTYKYGYIVDFVDIDKEYDRTIEAYLKELEADINENGGDETSLDGLIVDKEDIKTKYDKLTAELEDIIDTDNLEKFSKRLQRYKKEDILTIRRLLNGIKECHTEFLLSKADDYADLIDMDHLKKLLNTTQEAIDFINLKDNTVSMLDVISNDEVVDIIYKFIKVKTVVLNLEDLGNSAAGKRFVQLVSDVQKEIKENQNKDDPRIRYLDELLQEVFNKLSISNLDDLDDLSDELAEALRQLEGINEENARLASEYDGNYAFVKTYQDAVAEYSVEPKVIEQLLKTVYEAVKDVLDKNIVTVQGRKNFIDAIKHKVTVDLVKKKLFKDVKTIYDPILNDLYNNIQLFK